MLEHLHHLLTEEFLLLQQNKRWSSTLWQVVSLQLIFYFIFLIYCIIHHQIHLFKRCFVHTDLHINTSSIFMCLCIFH